MYTKNRERLVRLFVASLLQSDLSLKELQIIADSLRADSVALSIRSVLYDVLLHLRDVEPQKFSHLKSDSNERAAYSLIQQRRLSKKTLIQLISTISPRITSKQKLGGDAQVREILREFFGSASREEISQLMEMLGGKEKPDAYLQGIIRRK